MRKSMGNLSHLTRTSVPLHHPRRWARRSSVIRCISKARVKILATQSQVRASSLMTSVWRWSLMRTSIASSSSRTKESTIVRMCLSATTSYTLSSSGKVYPKMRAFNETALPSLIRHWQGLLSSSPWAVRPTSIASLWTTATTSRLTWLMFRASRPSSILASQRNASATSWTRAEIAASILAEKAVLWLTKAWKIVLLWHALIMAWPS